MGRNNISLKDAYIIETLRSNHVNDQEIIDRVEANDTTDWQVSGINIDVERLVQLGKEVNFRSIIEDGYSVKFVTLKGLVNLLKLKFYKEEELDYEPTPNGIAGLHVDDNELAALRQMLSQNWHIESERGTVNGIFTVSIQIKQVQLRGKVFNSRTNHVASKRNYR